MFNGFQLEMIDVGPGELRVRHGGSGPALLLLHGHPRTHMTWGQVADLLSLFFSVVCPDLRGFGRSFQPPILDALERADEKFARLWWHWFFFATLDKPERAIRRILQRGTAS